MSDTCLRQHEGQRHLLTTLDDPNMRYVADGMGVDAIEKLFKGSLAGYWVDNGQYSFGNGTQLLGTAITLSHSIHVGQGHDTQASVDAEWIVIRAFQQNIATGLTNS